MEEYTRKCPECGNTIIHSSKYNRNAHEKKKTPCKPCSSKQRYKKYGNNIDVVNAEMKSGIRKNGFQDKRHTKESRKLISQSHSINSESYKTQEFRDKMSSLTFGKLNPMYGKKVFDIWVEKYGIEEAKKREIAWKAKISLKKKGNNNSMYGKETPLKAGTGIHGWYKTFYFRSLHELKFILVCKRFGLRIKSAENLRIKYLSYTGNERTYSPDYVVDDKYLVEVKPLRLHDTPLNALKFESAKKYCDENNLKFKVLDFGIVYQHELDKLISNKIIKLN
jgi:hypothetical protein